MDLRKWCELNLLRKDGRINANKTRSNFKWIQTNHPLIWARLNGKTLILNNTKLIFEIRQAEQIVINDIIVFDSLKERATQTTVALRHLASESEPCVKSLVKILIKFNLKITLAPIIKKIFKSEYNKILTFSENNIVDRESVYRYIHDIKIKPYLNGKQLQMTTLAKGFSYYKNYLIFQKLGADINNMQTIIESSLGNSNFINKFFPTCAMTLIQKYKCSLPEAMYIELNPSVLNIKCMVCDNKPQFDTWANGYHLTCSRRCRSTYGAIIAYNKQLEHARKMFNDQNKIDCSIKEYTKNVRRLTEYTYSEYKHSLNCENNIRGNDFHLDHIIPIKFGYLANLHPSILAHRFNLQVLTSTANLNKSTKLKLTDTEILTLIGRIEDDRSRTDRKI